jgi:hypothetical protein
MIYGKTGTIQIYFIIAFINGTILVVDKGF